jgi:leucyl-tRNA synthetase
VADYVLGTYGTGAIMAVPAEDERDFAFATVHGLPIVRTTQPPEGFRGRRVLGRRRARQLRLHGRTRRCDAKVKATEYLAEHANGVSKVNYRLRDWLVSRQRFWGCPIPIVYCEDPRHGPSARGSTSRSWRPMT